MRSGLGCTRCLTQAGREKGNGTARFLCGHLWDFALFIQTGHKGLRHAVTADTRTEVRGSVRGGASKACNGRVPNFFQTIKSHRGMVYFVREVSPLLVEAQSEKNVLLGVRVRHRLVNVTGNIALAAMVPSSYR